MQASARFRLVTAVAACIAALGVFAPTAGALPATDPPVVVAPGTSNLFGNQRDAAIAAARQRLRMDLDAGIVVRDNCAVAPADVVGWAAGTAGVANVQLSPWSQHGVFDQSLPPGDGGAIFQTVLRCATARPDSDAAVRPSVVALLTDTGRSLSSASARPIAQFLGVEPIVPVRSASLRGEVAGSCQRTASASVCAAVWLDRGLVLGVQLDGDPTVLTPSATAALLDAMVPATVNRLAVRALTPASCDIATIAAHTGVQLLDGIVCAGGYAAGVTQPCADYGCAAVELFHLTPTGWWGDGTTASACPEALAALGPTPVIANALAAPFQPRPVPADPSVVTTSTLPPLPPCNPRDQALGVRSLRAGHQGPRVTALQAALVAHGYDLPVDGTFGPLTTAAVLDFQTLAGITVDALVGSQTRAALGV